MNLAKTGARLRSHTGQADESFRRPVESLSQLLASRAPDPPAPFPETELFAARDEATAIHRRSATAVLLLIAAIAIVGAGIYSFLQSTVPPRQNSRIEKFAAARSPPAVAQPVTASAIIVPSPVGTAQVSAADLSLTKPVVGQPLDARRILDLQARLNRLGFSPGSIDGVAGPMTISAIKRFQQSRGGPQAGAIDDDVLDEVRKEPTR